MTCHCWTYCYILLGGNETSTHLQHSGQFCMSLWCWEYILKHVPGFNESHNKTAFYSTSKTLSTILHTTCCQPDTKWDTGGSQVQHLFQINVMAVTETWQERGRVRLKEVKETATGVFKLQTLILLASGAQYCLSKATRGMGKREETRWQKNTWGLVYTWELGLQLGDRSGTPLERWNHCTKQDNFKWVVIQSIGDNPVRRAMIHSKENMRLRIYINTKVSILEIKIKIKTKIKIHKIWKFLVVHTLFL